MRLKRSQMAALVLQMAAGSVMAQTMTMQAAPVGVMGVTGGGAAVGTGAPGGAATNAPLGQQLQPADASGRGGPADAADTGSSAEAGSGLVREPLVQNEFQRFVYGATGQQLPLFGVRYFSGRKTGFGALERAPVPANYVLGPGDELQIRIWGAVDVELSTRVDRNGQINIPRVGTIGVAGLKAGEIEPHLRNQIGRVLKNFSLNVTLGQLRSVQIFVVGNARQPGSYTVSSLSTLVNVVFASGGPDANGSMRNIQLRRDGQVVAELDLYEFIFNGSKGQDVRVLPGDVVVYKPAGPRVALLGSLDTPAIYELKSDRESVAQLLLYGGGTRASTNLSTALLERIDASSPKAPRHVSTVDLTAADRLYLRDGDLLTLFGVAPAFSNAVTLRGNVAAPLRYPFAPGMRISGLIPDRDALITPDYYLRKNKLVQFVQPLSADEATSSAGAGNSGNQSNPNLRPDRTRDSRRDAEGVLHDVKHILDEPNWEYAVVERLNTDKVSTQLIPFNLAKAVVDRDPAHDLVLQPGDVVTVFALKDIRNPVSRQNRLVRLEGEISAPGVYQLQAGETMQQLLVRAGGLTPQAYVFGTEFSREETRKHQQQALDEVIRRMESQLASSTATQAANLSVTDAQSATQLRMAQTEAAKAQLERLRKMQANGRISLNLPPTVKSLTDLPDLPMEDGDRVVVPSRPAFVSAAGAVANSNALLWKRGNTASDYLDIAGVDVEADMENMFILRADGTVIHTSRRGWFNSIEGVELMPGDTVVVPERTNRETFWTSFTRGLKDWSQILYQFGLGAAAIKTLRQ